MATRGDAPARPGWLLGIVGLLAGVLAGLLYETPAALLRLGAGAASARQLVLEQPTGGLWSGSAGLSWQAPGRPAYALGRWQWSFTLSGGLPAWRLQPLDGPWSGHGTLRPGFGEVELRELELEGNASALPPGLGAVDMIHPGGRVALRSPRLHVAGGRASGQGSLAWRDASSALVALAPLGSWHADWKLKDSAGDYTVVTERGPLEVDAHGRIGADGHVSVQARAWSDPGSARMLLPLLQLIGPPAADGSVSFNRP